MICPHSWPRLNWPFTLALALACLSTCAEAKENPTLPLTGKEIVGRLAANRYLTPTNQVLTPAGRQVELPKMRPQALALSPDGKLLVVAGKTSEIAIVDPANGTIRQKVTLPGKLKAKGIEVAETQIGADTGAQLSLTGLAFSPDGTRLFLANTNGDIKVFSVDAKHHVTGIAAFVLPPANAPKRKPELPAGLAVSADGKRLYVAANLGNKLLELDAQTGNHLREWPCGVAPYDVALVGNKAYVSNLGGRRPKKGDLVAPAGRGTSVRVDPKRFIASEGSVTIIDLAANSVRSEIITGLHASALAVSPDRKYLAVANSGSDTISVIDLATEAIVEKIWARQTPADLFGAQPNALAFHPNGERLYVCNGSQNAVAVIRFEPDEKESKMLGLIPVGWFPGAVVFDPARKALCVANIKGIGAAKIFKPGEKIKLQTKDHFGTVSIVPLPSGEELPPMTALAMLNMQHGKMVEAALPPRPDAKPRPVPERVGEPSVFKHVIYVIKENRSYDQVLGDVKAGNGDASLCIFGEKFTPNQHKLVREFALLDNTYCSGVQSADGHQWTDSAIANEYMERQLTAAYPRSYPGGKAEDAVDALAWASSGFIWDNALANGKTFRNYGEWMITEPAWKDKTKKGKPGWLDQLKNLEERTDTIRLTCRAGIPSLKPVSKLDTAGWDLNVPDVVRADEFIKELKQFEENGNFPNLSLLFLPNDHTGGTKGGTPTPATHVADNDLAFGRVVEAVSHSKFWPETCIIAIEDDPQAGWDHVSGYRTTCYVISPYTKRKQTVSTQYNQTSILRTIELILGLPPMNQMDATATPMSDCFVETPDLTPFDSVPNQIPLEQLNPEPKKVADEALRNDALASAALPLDEPDKCKEDVLNRILWRAMKGSTVPYPDWAIGFFEDDDD